MDKGYLPQQGKPVTWLEYFFWFPLKTNLRNTFFKVYLFIHLCKPGDKMALWTAPWSSGDWIERETDRRSCVTQAPVVHID